MWGRGGGVLLCQLPLLCVAWRVRASRPSGRLQAAHARLAFRHLGVVVVQVQVQVCLRGMPP